MWFEATPNATEGRGTSWPFTVAGAPDVDGRALAAILQRTTPRWRDYPFAPTWWKFNGTACGGVELVAPNAAGAWARGVELVAALRDAVGLTWDGSLFGTPGGRLLDLYAGTPKLRELLEAGASAAEVVAAFAGDAAAWEDARRPFLLYE